MSTVSTLIRAQSNRFRSFEHLLYIQAVPDRLVFTTCQNISQFGFYLLQWRSRHSCSRLPQASSGTTTQVRLRQTVQSAPESPADGSSAFLRPFAFFCAYRSAARAAGPRSCARTCGPAGTCTRSTRRLSPRFLSCAAMWRRTIYFFSSSTALLEGEKKAHACTTCAIRLFRGDRLPWCSHGCSTCRRANNGASENQS